MGETYSDYINRNLGMAQGAEQISSNRTAKFTTQATRQLMPSGSREPDIGQIISGDFYNHKGRDLTEVFTEEQLDYDTPWDWIQARIDAEDFSGLMIGDYIPITMNNKDINCVILGINTYKGMNSGDDVVPSHIDFAMMPKTVDDKFSNRAICLVNSNNSIDGDKPLYYSTTMYYYLNAAAGNVINSTTKPYTLEAVDYTENGFFLDLPVALKPLIQEKKVSCALRNSSTPSTVLTGDTAAVVASVGKIWLLSVFEICGAMVYVNAVGSRGKIQYPYFIGNSNRQRGFPYWTMDAYTNNSGFCIVDSKGELISMSATNTGPSYVPCFRLATTPPEP